MFSHFLRKFRLIASCSQSIRIGGRKWRLAPGAEDVFGSAGPDLDRWIAEGLAKVVKSGPHRTVHRVALPGGTVYVKHCRIMGPRAWARELLRPPKARLEFENLLALQQSGIAAVVPLAWGRAASPLPGESWLITKGLEAAVPFTEFVEQPLSAKERRVLAMELGRFFAKLHEAGVSHPDPHPGNLLVQDGLRFSLIDLHAVSLGRPLSWRAARANLILFNRWFQLRATRTDRLRFWKAYGALPPAMARSVERGTAASNLRFWAGRASRCLGNNRYFRKVKLGSLRGFAVRDLPNSELNRLLADPDALFSRSLKDSRTSKVAIVNLGGGDLILKRVNVRHWSEPFKNLLRPSAVLRSWINGHALRDRWLPTPRPLAMFHRYRRGLPAEGYLLTELVPEPEPLSAMQPAMDRLARTLRMMHDRGVSHRDLKAANILLAGGADPALIDLVGVRLGSSVPFKQRAKELARLNASFLSDPAVSRSVRLRFLLTYLNAGDSWLTDLRSWWNQIGRATTVKLAKNRRSGRPLA